MALEALAAEGDITPRPEAPPPPRYLPREPGEAPFQLPPLEPAPPAERESEGAQILLTQVVFEGNTVITAQELQGVAAPYIGRRLGEADIEELRRALTQYYVARGYVNSGALLERGAAAKEGVLAFRIVEGKISQVQIRGLERLKESYVTGRLVPRADEPLKLDALRERFQLMLDDPLFARINARLMPDVNAGDAILDLDVARSRPYQLTAFINNYRPPSISETAAGLSGNVRNLLGYGDLLELRWQETIDGKHSDTYSLGWRLPVSRYGTAVSLRLDHGQSIVVQAPLNALNITSRIDSTNIGISQPIIETLRHKLTLGVDRVDETITSTLLGEKFSFTPGVPAGVTDARLWRWWQEYTYRSETNAVVVRSTFSSETNNNEPAANAANVQAPPGYRYWLGQFQYAQRLGEGGIQAVVKGAVQRSGTPLLPVDAMSIGGVNTVRGYRENQLLGDRGELLSVQLDVPVFSGANQSPQLVAGPFFDWGRATNIGAGTNILSSGGLALKVHWQGVRVDFAVAKRLIHDPAIDSLSGSLQDQKIHLQLSYDFF